MEICTVCKQDKEEQLSYGELAGFNHAHQIAHFGWCACEDMRGDVERPFADCWRITCDKCGSTNADWVNPKCETAFCSRFACDDCGHEVEECDSTNKGDE